MNEIPSVIPLNLQKYFINLKNYIDAELYFYGSVIRNDYIQGKSDIDLCIFTDNEFSIIPKIKSYFHVEQKDFKKILKKYESNNEIIYGYNMKFTLDGIRCELHLYNEIFKDLLLNEMHAPLKSPFYINLFLYILKFFYYTIPLLEKETYSSIKNYYIENFIKESKVKYVSI